MKQFVIPQSPKDGGIYRLDARDFHYLIRVRRMGIGDEVPVLFATGLSGLGSIVAIGDQWLDLEVSIPKMHDPDIIDTFHRQVPIRLLLGYPKGKKLEQSIRQSVELGVMEIVPILCDHSVPEVNQFDWNRKSQRLGGIIGEAVQQSGGRVIPSLHPPMSLDDYLESCPLQQDEIGIFFHEKPLDQKLLREYLIPTPKLICVFVGPEGGISPREVELLGLGRFVPGYLGPRVLRCETAVVAALAAVTILSLEGSIDTRQDHSSSLSS